MTDKQKWTGERLETKIINETMVEHLHRYAITFDFIKNKKVLDIACGEGYGCYLMSKMASHITGIDIDYQTINKAKDKYNITNIDFLQGDIFKIPANKQSFDVITCFETLEHTDNHDAVLKELKRVLKPSGLLFISTPDKKNYSEKRNYSNPFHKKELYFEQFKLLVEQYFTNTSFFFQISSAESLIIPENRKPIEQGFVGDYNGISPCTSNSAMYIIAIASEIFLPDIKSSFFQNTKSNSELLEEEKVMLKKTITYRTGKIILAPFKFLHSLFNN